MANSNSGTAASASGNKQQSDLSFHYLPKPDDDTLIQKERKTYKSIFMENPFVPIGLTVTLGALGYGVYQLKTGDRKMSQRMMRLRVGAQAFTVIALLVGAEFAARKVSDSSASAS